MTAENHKEEFIHLSDLIGWDAWLRNAHYPRPTWFPSASRQANIAWGEFALNDTGVTAMRAIEALAEAELPLPPQLVHWAKEACETWRGEALGNGREVEKINTRESLADDYEAIYSLQMRGYPKAKATEMISETSTRSYQTLYDSRKYKAIVAQVKAGVHHCLLLAHLQLLNKGREEQAGQLVQEFSRFFGTDLAKETLEKYLQHHKKLYKSE